MNNCYETGLYFATLLKIVVTKMGLRNNAIK